MNSTSHPHRLQVDSIETQSIRLSTPTHVLQLSVLAPDLIRIQSRARSELTATESLAVVRFDWPAVPVNISVVSSHLEILTSELLLRISLRTGAWVLVDSHGLVLFESRGTGLMPSEKPSQIDLTLAEGESVFGLGENSGFWDLRGRQREFWNVDVLGIAPAIYPGMPSLYVSIPFALTLRDGRAAGLFWDYPGRQSWDVGSAVGEHWKMSAATGPIDLYLFGGPTVAGVVSRYTELTGRIPLPPRWGLGYHQCRYSYQSRTELERVARKFRKRGLPCDALYLDIHHMDGYRVFTFSTEFPRPTQMLERLRKQGFQVIAIVDPGVKDDPDFGVLQRGLAENAFVKTPDGEADFIGEAWPGSVRFPDFFQPGVRRWWGEEQKALIMSGVGGVWNDMNEPANFARPDKTLPPDCTHRVADRVLRHCEIHNAYGSQMARASRDGLLHYSDGRRPFVITRAGYAGVQRHALVWTGDNSSTWEHLRDVIPQLLHLSLSGVPFCGADVGGFLGNCSRELFIRWFQLGALTPFFRNHSDLGTRPQEPWCFGLEAEEICRLYLRLRYQLLPWLYCLMAESSATGAPLMRPLLWHYSNDPRSVSCSSQFMLGSQLMVAPILEAGAAARSVYLPPDLWYDYWTGEKISGGEDILVDAPIDRIPVFVRAGAIIPHGEVGDYSGAEGRNAVTLACWPSADGTLDWYEDDENTEAYHQGIFHRRTIQSSMRAKRFQLHFSTILGPFSSRVEVWKIRLTGAKSKTRVRLNENWIQGLFDAESGIFEVDIPNSMDEIKVTFTGL